MIYFFLAKASFITLTVCIRNVGAKPRSNVIPKFEIFIILVPNRSETPGTNTARHKRTIPAKNASSENLLAVIPRLKSDLSPRQLKPWKSLAVHSVVNAIAHASPEETAEPIKYADITASAISTPPATMRTDIAFVRNEDLLSRGFCESSERSALSVLMAIAGSESVRRFINSS